MINLKQNLIFNNGDERYSSIIDLWKIVLIYVPNTSYIWDISHSISFPFDSFDMMKYVLIDWGDPSN